MGRRRRSAAPRGHGARLTVEPRLLLRQQPGALGELMDRLQGERQRGDGRGGPGAGRSGAAGGPAALTAMAVWRCCSLLLDTAMGLKGARPSTRCMVARRCSMLSVSQRRSGWLAAIK
jgi:hypothetical protein